MKKIYLLILLQFLIFNPQSTFAQVGQWVWIHGTSGLNSAGNPGLKGVPNSSNEPPALYEPCEWTDLNGNFWMFGGTSVNANVHDDLWKYDPVANEWTWVTGTNTLNSPGNYGTQGVSSASNNPPGRGYGFASWVDLSGNLWMFGGDNAGTLSDLWKFDIAANEWTWMKGPSISNQPGVYGTQGVPDTANNPGSREECAAAWTDNAGDLWLFGGLGYGSYNDMWRYNIATNTWTWMKGSQLANQPGIYGLKGVEDSLNTPGAREVHCRWKDKSGNLWLFGGEYTNFSVFENYGDLWKFNPITNDWTWMNGDSLPGGSGIYKTKCVMDSANSPPALMENRAAWTDANGNLWMFGGGIDPFEAKLMNHLWMYCIVSNLWTWMSGDTIPNQSGNWGTLNVSASTNKPSGRGGSVGWIDQKGHLFLFGGTFIVNSTVNPYNDLWEYTIDPCCTSCNPVSVVPSFQADVASFCPGGCSNFTDHSVNATSWQWSFPGGNPSSGSGQNPPTVCYDSSGTYNVTLIASNCNGNDTLTLSNFITVYSTPKTPVIRQSFDTLFCSFDTSYASFQWYSDTSLIPGATDSLLIVTHGGNYNLNVTNANGCGIAVGITVVLGIKNYSTDNSINVFPNPATNELIITGNREEENNIITIYNVLGQEVQEEKIRLTNGAVINVKNLSAGIYFIALQDEKDVRVAKFVKE